MWHVALWSRHWISQVAAPCNVACGSVMTCYWIRQVAALCNVVRGSGMTCDWIRQVAAPCNVTRGSVIKTLNSPGVSTLQCNTWLWDHDIAFASEFARWQHPAMWHVALGWYAIKFAQTSAILHYSTSGFDFDHITAVDMSFCTSLGNFVKIGPPSAKKWTSCRFSRWRISAILDYKGPITGSLKNPCTTSYRSSIKAIALNCLRLRKSQFLHFGDRQTDKQPDKPMDKPIILSRCREHVNVSLWRKT